MAFVVRRPRGRWEIRESRWTPKGPRSRSLATFSVLNPSDVARAREAATTPVSEAQLLDAARRAGAPLEQSAADRAARTLLVELAAGRPPAPGLRRMLLAHLTTPPEHDPVGGGVVEWLTASDEDRGQMLYELLELTDRYPPRPRGPLRFPPLRPAGASGD